MIVLRVLWVADVVILARQDLKERQEEEQEEEEEEEQDNDKGDEADPYDDYYGDTAQISDKNFIIYFAIQVSQSPLPSSPPDPPFFPSLPFLGIDHGDGGRFDVGHMCPQSLSFPSSCRSI
jgi:hypothetical protein